MLSVLVWFGNANLASLLGHVRNINEIKVFSQLGGGCVGSINLLANQDDASKVLISMQRQIAKLMPHKLRDWRDVVIYAGHVRLTPPDFGYTYTPYKDFATRLVEVIKAKKVDVKYDEADEHAMKVLDTMAEPSNFSMFIVRGLDQMVYVSNIAVLPRELRALLYHRTIAGIHVKSTKRSSQYALVDMSVLLDMPNLRLCCLQEVFPSRWRPLENMTCITVDFKTRAFDIPDELLCLPMLEELHVKGPGTMLPQSWGNLTSLNLTYTCLCVHDLIQSIVATPSITKLVFISNTLDAKQGRAIPTEFGNLTSLKELRIVCNHFCGSVPKEISRLTNLTKLHVQESFRHCSFEPIVHPSIVALNIADLVIGFVDDLGIAGVCQN
jgi:hypothetical protein